MESPYLAREGCRAGKVSSIPHTPVKDMGCSSLIALPKEGLTLGNPGEWDVSMLESHTESSSISVLWVSWLRVTLDCLASRKSYQSLHQRHFCCSTIGLPEKLCFGRWFPLMVYLTSSHELNIRSLELSNCMQLSEVPTSAPIKYSKEFILSGNAMISIPFLFSSFSHWPGKKVKLEYP